MNSVVSFSAFSEEDSIPAAIWFNDIAIISLFLIPSSSEAAVLRNDSANSFLSIPALLATTEDKWTIAAF